jgi:hypothetical protein
MAFVTDWKFSLDVAHVVVLAASEGQFLLLQNPEFVHV